MKTLGFLQHRRKHNFSSIQFDCHACFPEPNVLCKTLKTTLKVVIKKSVWATPHKDTSRLFIEPKSGRIAVKEIIRLDNQMMMVFGV